MWALECIYHGAFLAFCAISVEFVACIDCSMNLLNGPCFMVLIEQCAGANTGDMGMAVGLCNWNLDRANNAVLGHPGTPERFGMSQVDISKWNRSLVEETIEALESSASNTAEAISRLRNFLAVNPGRPTIGPNDEVEDEVDDGFRMVDHPATADRADT
jgi:hypothetical protein